MVASSVRLVDIRNAPELSRVLSQVLLLVEHINVAASREAWKLRDAAQQGELQSSVNIIDLRSVVLQSAEEFLKGRMDGTGKSPIVGLMEKVGQRPKPDREVVLAACNLLLRPARVRTREADKHIEASGETLHLPRAGGPDRGKKRAWIYKLSSGPVLATRPVSGNTPVSSRQMNLYFWEEPLDPLAVVRLFIADSLGERGRAADHYLQTWLRHTFELRFDTATKYGLAAICERFNTLFYEMVVPTTQVVHSIRSTAVSSAFLIHELADILPRTLKRDRFAEDNGSPHLKQALGIFLFLKFCRQLRSRYLWIDPPVGVASEPLEVLNGSQCVNALRPLGYTYFQSRIFGIISRIPGLSNILRGGLLPRTESGQAMTVVGSAGAGKTVFALQMVADTAASGGLSVYFSLEEGFEQIVDRLVTFGLFNRERFSIKEAGEDVAEVIRSAQAEDPLKGVLILYRPEARSFSLREAIVTIGAASETWPGTRSLVVDSVNALFFAPLPSEGGDRAGYRRIVQSLVSSIRQVGYFGVLLAEEDGSIVRDLRYLSDSIVELSYEEASHTRWFEVRKCRTQDYHPGKHPFRIVDGRGVSIYPSLTSRRSSLRDRIRSTISEQRLIPFPVRWRKALGLPGILEKSSTLLWGPPGSGKTVVLLNLLTEPSALQAKSEHGEEGPTVGATVGLPTNVLVVTFRTPERNLDQALRRRPGLMKAWQKIQQKIVRWYSPGENLSTEQIFAEIWRLFQESRRQGTPIERVVFEEMEVAEDFLPSIRRETLFWPSLLELTSREAATSFFVCGSDNGKEKVIQLLRSSMDYVMSVTARPQGKGTQRIVRVEQHPDLPPIDRKMEVDLRLDTRGRLA